MTSHRLCHVIITRHRFFFAQKSRRLRAAERRKSSWFKINFSRLSIPLDLHLARSRLRTEPSSRFIFLFLDIIPTDRFLLLCLQNWIVVVERFGLVYFVNLASGVWIEVDIALPWLSNRFTHNSWLFCVVDSPNSLLGNIFWLVTEGIHP